MNARSLVGMSQSARKRAARRDAVRVLMDASHRPWHETDVPGEYFHDPACWIYPKKTLDALRRLVEYEDATQDAVCYSIKDQGAKYRIGERLRPCLNCMKCWPWTETLEGDLAAALAPPKGAPRRFRHLELDDLCDGSGVIAKGSADV